MYLFCFAHMSYLSLEGVHLANKCDLRAQVRRGSEGGKAWEQGAIIKVAAASERAFSKKRLF